MRFSGGDSGTRFESDLVNDSLMIDPVKMIERIDCGRILRQQIFFSFTTNIVIDTP
jgi:hypothetical protein